MNNEVHQVERHAYVPDLMAMGDCRVCGRFPDDAVHDMHRMSATNPAANAAANCTVSNVVVRTGISVSPSLKTNS